MKKLFYVSLLACLIVWACEPSARKNGESSFNNNSEAREDSIELAEAFLAQSAIKHGIGATVQSEPVKSQDGEDAADDPALWQNSQDSNKSIVFGTNKKSGVHAYDLDGNELTFYPLGKINNIDVRQNIRLGDQKMDILGGSNRSDNSIVIMQIDSMGRLSELLSENFRIDTTIIDEVYGFCLYKDSEEKAYAIVNGKNGKIHLYELQVLNGVTSLKLTQVWQVDSQPEGMVADDSLGYLYIGEEDKGIWKASLLEPDRNIELLAASSSTSNPNIVYDIEGLAIYADPNGGGFLLASIQGNFSYAVFDRLSNAYLGSFKILSGQEIDGVEETDGLDIYSGHFGDRFPNGILVVQDGFNEENGLPVNQNFKYLNIDSVRSITSQFQN
jgi:3-phytase